MRKTTIGDATFFPTLYGLDSKGGLKLWTVIAEGGDDNTGFVKTIHGKQGGKMQESCKTVHPKNVGRANETTGFEQAVSEAQSLWNKKRDKQYCESVEELKKAPVTPLPMLAHPYEKQKHKAEWPCLVQPKLNGVRCLAERVDEDTVKYYSRGGKEYKTLGHLTPQLLEILTVGEVFDGEVFNPSLEFEEISSIVKSEKVDKGRGQLQFHIYDYPSWGGNYTGRLHGLRVAEEKFGEHLFLVPTYSVSSPEEMLSYHAQFVEQGYEGTMIRNYQGKYKYKDRSTDLLKYKEFFDAEFEIIGGRDGDGKFEGHCIFLCKAPEGCVDREGKPIESFEVVPKGTSKERQEYFTNLKNYIGKYLTVRFQAYSVYGIPLFPVGIEVREGELVNGEFKPDY